MYSASGALYSLIFKICATVHEPQRISDTSFFLFYPESYAVEILRNISNYISSHFAFQISCFKPEINVSNIYQFSFCLIINTLQHSHQKG